MTVSAQDLQDQAAALGRIAADLGERSALLETSIAAFAVAARPESPAGTVVVDTVSRITTAAGDVLMLQDAPDKNDGRVILLNGARMQWTRIVDRLCYLADANGRNWAYQRNNDDGWWRLNDAKAWDGSADPTAPATPAPAPSTAAVARPAAAVAAPAPTAPVASGPAQTGTVSPAQTVPAQTQGVSLVSPAQTVPVSPGPAASSPLLTIEFNKPLGAHAPAAAWGIASAAMQDDMFAACLDETWLQAAASVSPAALRLNSNAGNGWGKNSSGRKSPTGFWTDDVFRNGIDKPDWEVVRPFTDNAYRFVRPDCLLTIGVRLDGRTPADYARMCLALVDHLQNTPGKNGAYLKVWGLEIGNENDGLPIDQYCALFRAAAEAVQSRYPDTRILGPVDSWMHTDRSAAVAKLGVPNTVIDYHGYFYGAQAGVPAPADAALFGGTRAIDDITRCRAAVGDEPAIAMLEYGIDFNAGNEPRAQNVTGAVFAAAWIGRALLARKGLAVGGWWEWTRDGFYGVIRDDGSVSPAGRFLSQAGRVLEGDLVAATLAGADRLCIPVVSGNKVGILVANWGGAFVGPVALSRFPGRPDGNGMLSWWSQAEGSPGGVMRTAAVSAGVSAPISFPEMSNTLLWA